MIYKIIRSNSWDINHGLAGLSVGFVQILAMRNCGEKVLYLKSVTCGTPGNYYIEFQVSIDVEKFSDILKSYVTENEVLLTTQDLNTANDFYLNTYNGLVGNRYIGKSWETIMDTLTYSSLLDDEPNIVEKHYYEKFTQYLESRDNILCYKDGELIYSINDMTGELKLYITKEFIDMVIYNNDYDMFFDYLVKYCNHREIEYKELEHFLVPHFEKVKHCKISI